MNLELLSFQTIYNLWKLLKDLIEKKDNNKKSAKRPTGGTVTVKGKGASSEPHPFRELNH